VPSPKRFDQTRPFATLGIIIVVWLLLPAALKRFGRASFFEFEAPLEFAASHVRDLQEYWSLRLRSNDDLIEAGRDLGRLTASYENTVRENAMLRQEIDRFEQLLRVPEMPGFHPEIARVVRRDFTGWWQELIIRKGRVQGIVEDAPVIFSGGLVGRVREVRAYESVVELISSPTLRLIGVIEGDNRPITFQGGVNTAFSQPRGTIEYVPLEISLSSNAPRYLVTSGLGGNFPPGLYIGRITQLERSSDGLFSSGLVELDNRLSALREVTVLIPDRPPIDVSVPGLDPATASTP